ncbi:MAG: hypothetical protein AAF789_04785, partial [Bacteroidota bacterium]
MSKRSKYLFAIGFLILGNAWLLLRSSGGSDSTFETSLFTIPTETISAIEITNSSSNQKVVLKPEKEGESWLVNETYPADNGLVRTLLTLFERVESKKKIGKLDSVLGTIAIKRFDQEQVIIDFGSNLTRTKTFFVKNGEGFEVGVPGYQSNPADLFLLQEDQWKSRLILDTSWRTIQVLELS